MAHFLDIIIQWLSKGQLPHINISWWIDAPATIVGIILLFVLFLYADRRMRGLQELEEAREKAIDKLIKSHNEEREQ